MRRRKKQNSATMYLGESGLELYRHQPIFRQQLLPRPAPRPAQWRLSGGACPALSAAEWPTLIRNLGPARRDSPLGPDPLFGPIFSLHQKFPNLMGNRWRPPARESPQWRRGPAVLGSSWGTKKSWCGGGRAARAERYQGRGLKGSLLDENRFRSDFEGGPTAAHV